MDWISIERMAANVRLPRGYRLALPARAEVTSAIGFIRTWFPDVSVGGASCFLRESFFADEVYFADAPERDVIVVLIRRGRELAGLFACERDRDTLALYARLAIVAPRHRGERLGQCCIELAEAMGREMGMEMVYGMATLKIPHVQQAFEHLGWQLIGITPGYDREMVEPGVVKRVYEAVYAKVLVSEAKFLRPRLRNLTRKTRTFFRRLFPKAAIDRA